jgi:23S rRNA pseudouridine1911/1915/1917 synthase
MEKEKSTVISKQVQNYVVNLNNTEINLKILYEDNHIIVVEKLVNIPSQGDKTADLDMLTIIKEYLRVKYNKPGNVYLGLIHRLDRPVGGVMVFAKTSKAASRLSEQVREKIFKKKYLVIVDGNLEKEKGIFQDYLLKNARTNMSKVVKEGTKNSKLAELDYEVLKYDQEKDISLVKVNLHTGRHHQIRVQFSSRNHAIYGDQKYGERGQRQQICLWAYSLTILHPVSKEEMTFIDLPAKEKTWKILDGIEIA